MNKNTHNNTEAKKEKSETSIDISNFTWTKKAITGLKITFQIIIVLILMLGSFHVGTIYNELENKEVIIENQEVKKIGETSVSINERNELMILDRNLGSYQIYQDSIGISIFWLYAKQLHEEVKDYRLP